MTPLSQLKDKLQEMKKARELATHGEWVIQQNGLSNFDDPYVFDRIYGEIFQPRGSTPLARRPNSEFICLAANEWLSLIEKLEIAIEFLEMKSKRSQYIWSNGGDYSPDDYANEGQIACATEALQKISEEK